MRAPLYDPRFDHDACGVGFVADTSGIGRDRILPLALAGLAALRHRGAVAADGQSSDGAGVLLPLAPSVRAAIDPQRRRGSGVLVVFEPRSRRASAAAARIVEEALAVEGLTVRRRRVVPVRAEVLGSSARATRPRVAHLVVDRPGGWSAARFETALAIARRRIETAARDSGMAELSVASASARSVVYKALVTGDALVAFYPDLARPHRVPFAMFHQRFATNTHPTWSLAQPFAHLAHNGEINTVRGNREEVRGRTADVATTRLGRRLLAAGPLLAPDGSDSRSLDDALGVLIATGRRIDAALVELIPDAPALRRTADRLATPEAAVRGEPDRQVLAPWDGPGAFVFSDGLRVGALTDRNGLRPLAVATTRDGIVAAASEAGAVPLPPEAIVRQRRLGPGELLVVDARRRVVFESAAARAALPRERRAPKDREADVVLAPAPHRRAATPAVSAAPPSRATTQGVSAPQPPPTPVDVRYLLGLDAERLRLSIRTMALEGHEPLWSMGDDTPTAGLARVGRPVADFLRQAFAQVTNPPIDPERERAVMDLSVEVGARPSLVGRRSRSERRESPFERAPTAGRRLAVRLDAPIQQDVDLVRDALGRHRVRSLDATWPVAAGASGLRSRLEQLGAAAVRASRRGCVAVVVSDRRASRRRVPVPSVLAVGAVHAALVAAGLRGRTDVVAEAGDVLDVHALAMNLAAGSTCVVPWLAIELAGEQAGSRGAEELRPEEAVDRLVTGFEAGLRKVLARMGISTMRSYVGGALFETFELAEEVRRTCFPAAPGWPGRIGFEELGTSRLDRVAAAAAVAATNGRLPDHGLARFRGDGERHLYAPRVVGAIQALSAARDDTLPDLAAYRATLSREPATVRDMLAVRRSRSPLPIADVEPATAIARRFVAAAMSVGALSPEAHRAVTLGMQRAGGAANTGEGGEDPAWYRRTPTIFPGTEGREDARPDARIKQVASARFGVTAEYLVRAEQLEIKIAQGSKPGEGGQLPGRKATAYIAALRRAQPGQALISPPPHHDIYSIEDLAQLITDLRAINPGARIGVKLVASRGIGTIASGVAKAGADYVHVSGHAGGTGASPLSSIKHVGAPWELGLAEVHQALLANGLRDRVVLRTDGGLQTGRDVLIAGLLGAEEVAFGTALLVALGCDMARQCHLDTCPTGIATQREDLRAKFAGSPEDVERLVLAIAEDVRAELAAVGARTFGEIVGRARDVLRPVSSATLDLAPVLGASPWHASNERRERWSTSRPAAARPVASPREAEVVAALALAAKPSALVDADVRVTTADRSFGAGLAGAIVQGEVASPLGIEARGSAGQSFGAFLPDGATLTLTGQANDYVAKGLSGGTIVVRPDPALDALGPTLVGNTCLYGATAGRVHVVGRAGMRFAVRNSGARAVVEGIGAHGCEYMTGGVVVVLGPIGPNFGAGMTGGRAYLLDPHGRHLRLLHESSVVGVRVADAVPNRLDAPAIVAELRDLLTAHAAVGSRIAADLLGSDLALDRVWLVEPVDGTLGVVAVEGERGGAATAAAAHEALRA